MKGVYLRDFLKQVPYYKMLFIIYDLNIYPIMKDDFNRVIEVESSSGNWLNVYELEKTIVYDYYPNGENIVISCWSD